MSAPASNGDSIAAKVAHVRAAPQCRRPHCHWSAREKQVPPAAWGWTRHWFILPNEKRRKIWRTYRKGQEQDGRPSAAYVEAAREAKAWIVKNHPLQPEPMRLL